MRNRNSRLRARQRGFGAGGAAPWNSSMLPGLLALVRVGAGRAAGQEWQDAGPTPSIPALVANDQVRLAQSRVASPVDMQSPGDDSRMNLRLDAGVWSLETDGGDLLTSTTDLVLPSEYHWWFWIWNPIGFASTNSLFGLYNPSFQGGAIGINSSGNYESILFSPQVAFGAPTTGSWDLIEAWGSGGGNHLALNGGAPVANGGGFGAGSAVQLRVGGSALFTAGPAAGTRYAAWGYSDQVYDGPTRALLYAAGPGA